VITHIKGAVIESKSSENSVTRGRAVYGVVAAWAARDGLGSGLKSGWKSFFSFNTLVSVACVFMKSSGTNDSGQRTFSHRSASIFKLRFRSPNAMCNRIHGQWIRSGGTIMNPSQKNTPSEDGLEADDSTQSASDDLDSTEKINADLEAELEAELEAAHDPDMNGVTRELLSHTDGISNQVDNQNDGVNDDSVSTQEYGDGRGKDRGELGGLTDSELFDGVNDQPAERFSENGV
jgi:hypothetical protein